MFKGFAQKNVLLLLSAIIFAVCVSCRKESSKDSESSPAPQKASTDVTFKAFSLAARDILPSRQEVEDFNSGRKGLSAWINEWSDEPDFLARVGRIYNDQFGVPDDLFIVEDSLVLRENSSGIFEPSDGTANCGTGQSAEVSPWWQDQGSVRICAAAACGPGALRCVPTGRLGNLRRAVQWEISERAQWTFQNNKSWKDFWASNEIFGSRDLAFVYLYESKRLESSHADGALSASKIQELEAWLRSVPLEESVGFKVPNTLPERSGIVTAPQFLKRFNNFRSRVRALAINLSCQDIGSGLNTSGISQFVNSDLSSFDLAHGLKAGCSSCHFGMDNLGSTLLGWNDVGQREFWKKTSQKGHAFGKEGDGPAFLANSWVERGPQFAQCMAQQVWKSLSGGRDFGNLPGGRKQALESAANQGMRELVKQTLLAPELLKVDSK